MTPAWDPPYAVGVALKSRKKERKREREREGGRKEGRERKRKKRKKGRKEGRKEEKDKRGGWRKQRHREGFLRWPSTMPISPIHALV